jgi:hypothetical protein
MAITLIFIGSPLPNIPPGVSNTSLPTFAAMNLNFLILSSLWSIKSISPESIVSAQFVSSIVLIYQPVGIVSIDKNGIGSPGFKCRPVERTVIYTSEHRTDKELSDLWKDLQVTLMTEGFYRESRVDMRDYSALSFRNGRMTVKLVMRKTEFTRILPPLKR